jgi:hypothetical protein
MVVQFLPFHSERRVFIALLALTAALSSASAAIRPIQFAPPKNFPLPGPERLCVADFNCDGSPDLVVSHNGIYLSILTNDGTGSFQISASINTSLTSLALAATDFNGDNKMDIVTANASSVSVWLNNGDGTFTRTNVAPGIARGLAVAAGDLNGDGKPDLAVLDSHNLQIYLGQGNGMFTFVTNYNVGDYAVSIGDFNGDGNLDLVTANYSYSSMSVLLGIGDGTFAPPVNYGGLFSEYHYSVAVGDFYGDGKLDLATINYYDTSVSVRLNNGDGTFGAENRFKVFRSPTVYTSPTAIAVADFNDDRNLDIVAGNPLSILPGFGDGTFAPATTNLSSLYYPGGSQTVAVADFDGDGRPDIATTSVTNNSVTVLLNRTAPALQFELINRVFRLKWPDWLGYTLESTTNLALPNSWAQVTNTSFVVNDQRIVTTSTYGARRFFRLKK